MNHLFCLVRTKMASCGDSQAEAKIKTDLLPKDYDYLFQSAQFKNSESFKFSLKIKKIKSEEDFKIWLSAFQELSHSHWNVSRSTFKQNRFANFAFAKNYECQLGEKNKAENSLRNQHCTANLTVRIKKDNKDVRYRDKNGAGKGYFTTVDVNFEHTHR